MNKLEKFSRDEMLTRIFLFKGTDWVLQHNNIRVTTRQPAWTAVGIFIGITKNSSGGGGVPLIIL